ncbi:MAG: TIM barrel protein [Armatimonadota bacterium]
MDIKLSIFPKFYQQYSPQMLADLVKEVNLDTTNVIIREGYFVERDTMSKTLPEFIKVMDQNGLKVEFASAGFSAESLIKDPTPLAIMADCGIKEFRLAYFSIIPGETRAALISARKQLIDLVPFLEKNNIRAVYQVHHHTLIPGPSGIWPIVIDLPPEYIGVELDPGNQSFEGYEKWDKSVELLDEYLVAMGVKDTAIYRDMNHSDDYDKGWRRYWVPIYDGVVNWHDILTALNDFNFKGTFVFMPFYDENNQEQMTKKLKKEVSYIRELINSF